MRSLITIIFFLGFSVTGMGQSFAEKSQKEFTFSTKSGNETLIVANVNGSVTVSGYDGDKVIVEAEKTIKAKTDEKLEQGKSKISIGYRDLSDTLILYVEGLCHDFGKYRNRQGGDCDWGYNWNNCQDNDGWVRDEAYDFVINFHIRVPKNTNVIVSTINNGDVAIDNIRGAVSADNINGSIRLDHLQNRTIAHTINGSLDLNYLSNPIADSRFYSLNGDINATFPSRLMATVSFDSFNGDFYTNMDNLELLPLSVEKVDNKSGIKFRVKGNRYKVGNGGVNLDFETFNGNVYLREKK